MKTLAILLLVAAVPSATFLYGMQVGRNDVVALHADDSRADKIAVAMCGPRAWIAKRGGERRCVYINSDQSAITRAVFDTPIGAM